MSNDQCQPCAEDPTAWVFRVEGFGEVGYANLAGFIPFPGFMHPRCLKVGEMTEGTAHMSGVTNTIRLWRER